MLARRPSTREPIVSDPVGPVAKVVVVGTTHTDRVVGGSRLPALGETVLGGALR